MSSRREQVENGVDVDMVQNVKSRPDNAPTSSSHNVVRVVYYYSDGNVVEETGNSVLRTLPIEMDPMESSQICRRANKTPDLYADDVTAAAVVPKPVPRLGDPTPLALMAFGSTTILFCSHVAGTSAMNTVTIGQVLFYGGMTQFICGVLEFINRNTFGGMAFCTYGAFWLHLVGGELLPRDGTLTGSTLGYEGGHAIVWFVISLTFLCSSLKHPLVTVAVFATLTLFFVIFAIGNFADAPNVRKAAGYEGIVCGSLAIYLSASMLLRDAYGGRPILPIFHHRNGRVTDW